MPLGSLDRAYNSEYHVPGKPHTYAQPTIYNWVDIRSGKFQGRRLQKGWKEARDRYIEGGLHMTHAPYLPNHILKTLTATESRNVTVMTVLKGGDSIRLKLHVNLLGNAHHIIKASNLCRFRHTTSTLTSTRASQLRI